MNSKPKWGIAVFLIVSTCLCWANKVDEFNEMNATLDRWEELAEKSAINPSEQNFKELARGARGLRHANFPIPRREEVNRKLRETMISIPNYGQRLKEILTKEREAWKTGSSHRYDRVRLNIIQTLEALPSPESVRVLGELLFDDSGVPYPLEKGFEQFSPPENPVYAQRALSMLLDDPPMDSAKPVPLETVRAQLKTWQLWFEQVKAGTRTFRFKGDPQPYTLEGPAERELRPGADNADPENHRRRTTQNREAAGSEDSADDPAQGANHWWMVGGGLGLVAVILLVWRKLRRTNAKR